MELEITTEYKCPLQGKDFPYKRIKWSYRKELNSFKYDCYFCSKSPVNISNSLYNKKSNELSDKLSKYITSTNERIMITKLKNALLRMGLHSFEELRYISPYCLAQTRNVGKKIFKLLMEILDNYFDSSTEDRIPLFDYTMDTIPTQYAIIQEKVLEEDWLLPEFNMDNVHKLHDKYMENLIRSKLNG